MGDAPSVGEMAECMRLILSDMDAALEYARSQEGRCKGHGLTSDQHCWHKVVERLEKTQAARKLLLAIAAAKSPKVT
jgi:hypothetical protein